MTVEAVSAPVAEALGELKSAYADRVAHEPDGSGGAFVTITNCALGDGWSPSEGDLALHLPFNYPWAAIYPYYLLTENWPETSVASALQRVNWRGRQVVQISLRHNGWTPEIDTALGCVRQVLQWARRQQ